MQAETSKGAVQNKGHARHVATVFKNGDKCKKKKEYGKIVENCRNTAHDPHAKGTQERVFQKAGCGQKTRQSILGIVPQGPDHGRHIPAEYD